MMYQEVDRSDPRKLKNSVDSLPDENSQNHTHHLKKKKKIIHCAYIISQSR
jgi:hypothetical protein